MKFQEHFNFSLKHNLNISDNFQTVHKSNILPIQNHNEKVLFFANKNIFLGFEEKYLKKIYEK